MARLTRKDMKVFAGSATNNSVFGSLQAGNPTITNDVEQIQSLAAWENGWNDATMTSEKLPPLEDLQTVSYVTTYQQAYLMQEGLPEWSATVTYYKGCLAKEVTLTGFKIYNSLTDNNTGNALSDTSNWKLVMDSEDLYALDSTVVHTADLGASSTIVGSDFPAENQNKVLWSATTGKVGTYPYFDANKLQYLNTITSDIQTQLNAKAADSAVVKLSGSQTVAGTKTFSSSPVIPTASSSDNSQKSANTAWVRTFVSGQVSNKLSATFPSASNNQRYIRFSNGFQIVMGTVTTTGSNNTVVNFIHPFTTIYSASATMVVADNDGYSAYIHSLSTTGISVHRYSNNSGTTVKFIAVGYSAS